MGILPPGRAARPRGVLVVVLLLLALGLAVVLAFQAQVAALYHRATADRVLHDYAGFAAARFAQRASQDLYYYALTPVLQALTRAYRASAGRALPAPAELARALDQRAVGFLQRCRYTFRLDLPTGRLRTSGAPAPPGLRAWVADTVRAHSRASFDRQWGFAMVIGRPPGAEAQRVIIYTLEPGGDRASPLAPTALGLEADLAALAPFFAYAAERAPLLPSALTGGVQYDSLGSVIVVDATGGEVYRSATQYPPTFAARDTLAAPFGRLSVQVALRPRAAAQLVIGGLPRSRFPIILALLGLTAGLIVTALVQLRREYELARLRSDFVAGVSHELRTPLAQIRMFSETLTLGRVRSEEEERRSLEIIDQEARRLTHLVENLLHFSRSERRLARVALERVELAPLVREAVESFARLAAARRTTLRTELAEGVIASVDAGALRQMLLNLLDNAVKYSPADRTVTIGLAQVDGRVRIWVDDQGPGIPPGDRERVWERFWRLERDRGSPVAGTGIGLAVVRELVALHSGRAWVEDAPGGGARFVLELPAAPGPATPASPPPSTA